MEETVAALAGALARHGVGDAFGRRTRGLTVEYRSNVLERVRYASSSGAGARVVEGGRLGAAGGTGPSDPARILEDTREAARFGPEVPDLELGAPSHGASEDLRALEATDALSTDALRALADEVVARVRDAHPDVLVDVTVARAHTEEHLANTGGLRHRATRARVRLAASAKRNRDGDLLTLSAGGSAPATGDPRVDPARVARELVERLDRCSRRATLTSGDWPVVFTGAAVAGLLYPLLQGLAGENLARGTSPLCGRTPRLAPWLHLANDPTLGDRPGDDPRDGDGHPARRVDLVRDGAIVGGCFDAVTAARYRHAGRTLPFGPDFGRPGCATRPGTGGGTAAGPSMLALTSSVPPLRDPLEGIRCGLLVENLLGVRMGNPLSGEFSNSVHVGYRIEDGVIVGRVKDLMVAGNVYALLADLEGLGARPEWDDDEALLPAVRARSVRVTSKA